MNTTCNIDEIDNAGWAALVEQSSTATWFQTREAYDFFDSLSFLEAFVVAVGGEAELKGLIVGYVQKDGGKLKQFFSRRAIITGGPLLADDITPAELTALLTATTRHLRHKAIYIETRNLNDYSRWRTTFEACGFSYEPHLNFHLATPTVEAAQSAIGRHRWRYIRLSLRDGAALVENPTLQQVRQFYLLLQDLYRTKVRMPLYPFEFFERLLTVAGARYLLVEYGGQVVGGSLCVCLPGKAVYEWAKCGDEHRHKNIRPSSLATWLGIRHAAENGYPRYDFMGAGKPDEPYGVRDFKAEFGGTLVEHGRYRYVANPPLYLLGTLAIKIMKRL